MKIHRLILLWSFLLTLSASLVLAAGQAKHVVVVVFDGMRPDFITDENTPTLTALVREGVFFQNHHSVFLTSTEVNGTAIATGAYPRHSGLMANYEYRPAIDASLPFGTEAAQAIRRGDTVTQGHYLTVPTLAEILQAAGRTTVIAGTKPVALLLDRKERPATARSVNLYEGASLPPEPASAASGRQGPFPPVGPNNKIARDIWTTTALLDTLWAGGVPDFSLLWLAEPDFSQHNTGPGSPTVLVGIKNSDDSLARVLRALEQHGVREQTDVLVVSDHGVSTIERVVDVATGLSEAGFNAVRAFAGSPAQDAVLVVGNGDTCALYVPSHDAGLIQRVVAWLQQQDYSGVIFTRLGVEGTFSLAEARIDTAAAPDVLVSLRWRQGTSRYGVAGLTISEIGSKRQVGDGNHTSLARYNAHNTLVAAGPDFRRGIINPLPTGNTDIAPTVLWLLGVPVPPTCDGRVLGEALLGEAPPVQSVNFTRLEAKGSGPAAAWRQYLLISEVNGVRYFDEGNGAGAPAGQP